MKLQYLHALSDIKQAVHARKKITSSADESTYIQHRRHVVVDKCILPLLTSLL